jgi:hypothetical protein
VFIECNEHGSPKFGSELYEGMEAGNDAVKEAYTHE